MPSRRLVKDPERYKTEMCATWTREGDCPYKQKCQFAHGKHELRTRSANVSCMSCPPPQPTPPRSIRPIERSQPMQAPIVPVPMQLPIPMQVPIPMQAANSMHATNPMLAPFPMQGAPMISMQPYPSYGNSYPAVHYATAFQQNILQVEQYQRQQALRQQTAGRQNAVQERATHPSFVRDDSDILSLLANLPRLDDDAE